MISIRKYYLALGGSALLVVAGCQTPPKAVDFFQPVTLQERTIQTRIYPTNDEIKILSACADLLLDNGFRINEVESRLGWIDAIKIKLVRYQGLFEARASVVTHKMLGRPGAVVVRVTLRCQGKVADPVTYEEFFLKLSQAVFLEAQRI